MGRDNRNETKLMVMTGRLGCFTICLSLVLLLSLGVQAEDWPQWGGHDDRNMVMNLKKVWSYDCNPPSYRFRDGVPVRYLLGDKRRKDSPNKDDGVYVGPSDIIATPVFHQGRIYVGIGQDPAHGRGRGLFHCIDATQTGDITKTGCVWSFAGIERTMATAAVAEGLVYVTDIAGKLYCLEADSGRCVWTYDTGAETWGGPLIADGKIYFGNKRGLHVLRTGREAVLLDKVLLGAPAYSTPIAAHGVLYVTSQSYLWAVWNTPRAR